MLGTANMILEVNYFQSKVIYFLGVLIRPNSATLTVYESGSDKLQASQRICEGEASAEQFAPAADFARTGLSA